jgi:transcriptional regulator with XRE-family HTH domain
MTGSDLKAWREARQWSQQQAADALGYTRRGYQDAEAKGSEVLRQVIELAVRGLESLESQSQ